MMPNNQMLWWPDACEEDIEAKLSPGLCIMSMIERGEAKVGTVVRLSWSKKIGSTLIKAKSAESWEVAEGDCVSDKADYFIDLETEDEADTLAELITQAIDAADDEEGTVIQLDVEQYVTGHRDYRIISAHEVESVPPEVDPMQMNIPFSDDVRQEVAA